MKPKSFNIALLANFTTEYIMDALQDVCRKSAIEPVIYNSPFRQYNQDILNIESDLYAQKPEVILLMLEGRLLFPEWFDFKTLQEDKEKKEALVRKVFEQITKLIDIIHSNTDSIIILNNFQLPYHSPLGILDGKHVPGLKQMIATLNMQLDNWSNDKNYLHIFDYNGLCAQLGIIKAIDRRLYYSTGNPMSFPLIQQLAQEYMRYILPLLSRNRKCLVLDLDNTLWGGIAAEEGLSGIKLDLSGPGRCFYDFQKEILNLYNKGIILAINSKNNRDEILDIMENHPYMLLKPAYFSCIKINWRDKASNMIEIANEINIGMDSLVFFDDSPVERGCIKALLPDVKVVDVPADTSRYADALESLADFETLGITAEDLKRNESYESGKKRKQYLEQIKNLDEYLAGLETRISVEYANSFNIPRIAQLFQKTNQFNMTTIRCRQQDIEEMAASCDHLVFSCSTADKFEDCGIIGACTVLLENGDAMIESFLLSCRALGRNIEYAFLAAVVKTLRENNVRTIFSRFVKTDRNKVNESFYIDAGFSRISSDSEASVFMLPFQSETKEFDYITTTIEIKEDDNG